MDRAFRDYAFHQFKKGKEVSILVLMDRAFRALLEAATQQQQNVSILVLMDRAFRANAQIDDLIAGTEFQSLF